MNRRERFIWFFISRLGGVSAVTRRIILRWRGVFTWNDIYGEFCRRYPSIDPHPDQLHDAIAHLKRRGLIEDVGVGADCYTPAYKRCERPCCFGLFRPKHRQLEFTW